MIYVCVLPDRVSYVGFQQLEDARGSAGVAYTQACQTRGSLRHDEDGLPVVAQLA